MILFHGFLQSYFMRSLSWVQESLSELVLAGEEEICLRCWTRLWTVLGWVMVKQYFYQGRNNNIIEGMEQKQGNIRSKGQFGGGGALRHFLVPFHLFLVVPENVPDVPHDLFQIVLLPLFLRTFYLALPDCFGLVVCQGFLLVVGSAVALEEEGGGVGGYGVGFLFLGFGSFLGEKLVGLGRGGVGEELCDDGVGVGDLVGGDLSEEEDVGVVEFFEGGSGGHKNLNNEFEKMEMIYWFIKLVRMQKYKISKTLGDGAFGTVYKAQNTKTGEVVAIKKMKQKYATWNQCIDLRQIKSLRKLNHSNIIKLKEVLHVAEELYMVFEYLDYNLYDVYSKMKEKGKSFTETEIKSMIYQILSGLAHMHKNGFFHRDMKPENLLTYNNIVKVCDMGLAREIRSRPPFTDYVSTRWYRAPELLLRSTNYNSPVDIFALGCIMAELYTLTPLFAGSNEVDQLNKIVKVLGTPDKNIWPEGYKLAQSKGYYFPQQKGVNLAELIPQASLQAVELIESMLHYSSRRRPTASELLKHEYFKGVKLPDLQEPMKEVIFEEKPTGAKLDTSKEDKKIDIFRATKEKFKQTRRQEALQYNLVDQHKSDQKHHDFEEDLDSLINELEEKGKKKKEKKDKDKLPFISTKEKFHKNQKKELRESKTELKHGQPYKHIEKEDWKFMKHEDSSYGKKGSSYKYGENSRKGADSKKFAYNFQPAFNPVFLPSVKTPYKPSPLNYQQLPKPKPLVPGPAIYKY